MFHTSVCFLPSSTLVDLGTLIKNFHYVFVSAWLYVNTAFSQTSALFCPKESILLQPQSSNRKNSANAACVWLPFIQKWYFHFEAEIKLVQNPSGWFGGVERQCVTNRVTINMVTLGTGFWNQGFYSVVLPFKLVGGIGIFSCLFLALGSLLAIFGIRQPAVTSL